MSRWNAVRWFGVILGSLLAAGCSGGGGGGTSIAPTYSVGGTVSGLAGSGFQLINGSKLLPLSANGTFTIATADASGTAYNIGVATQPQLPYQHCVVSNGSGTVGSAPVTSVSVVCTTLTFNVGGVVSGLVGSGLVLVNNGGDPSPVSGNGPFALTPAVASGTTYSVGISSPPINPDQTCIVTNGTGWMYDSPVTTVGVSCTDDFTPMEVSGTYSVVTYGGAGQIDGVWSLTFDGAGNVTGTEVQNNAGAVSSAAVTGSYAVATGAANITNRGLTITLAGSPALTANLSLDGNTLVMSQLTSGQKPGIGVGVKQGQTGLTNQNLDGTYAVVSYGGAATVGSVATLTFDGSGNVNGSALQNNGGTLGNIPVSGTYAVSADGVLTMTPMGGASLTGGVSADGNTLVLAQTTAGQSPAITVGIKQGQSNFSNLDAHATYAVASYDGSGTDGGLWTLAFDGSGGISGSVIGNSAGVVSSANNFAGTYAVGPGGSLTVSSPSGPALNGGLSAQGTTFVTGETTTGHPAGIQIGVPVNTFWASFSPSNIRFTCQSAGNVLLSCTPYTQAIVLKNTGTATLYVLGISSNAGLSLRPTNNCPATLSPAQSCTVEVSVWLPAAPKKAGSYIGNVVVLVNTVANPQTAVSLHTAVLMTVKAP